MKLRTLFFVIILAMISGWLLHHNRHLPTDQQGWFFMWVATGLAYVLGVLLFFFWIEGISFRANKEFSFITRGHHG